VVAVKGEGPFAEAVRKVFGYAQSRGVDLSGVEVEVAADPSIKDFGAYTEHLGGLKFRIRYNPRYANDVVLAAHEAGHVAYWAWAVKTGRTHFFSNPDVIEPLAEAFGAVTARRLFGVPVTFKDAPMNLTQALPQRTAYVTVTIGGKPTVVKVPEWGDSLSIDDYMKRYRAGILLSPYFYNMTNWAHVFGNFTAMPGDVIKTVHKAWQSGAVEVVPGWGAVWRTTPMWSWPADSTNKTTSTQIQQKPGDVSRADVSTVPQSDGDATQRSDTTTNNTTRQQTDDKKAVIQAQPSADVPLSPSTVQVPKYFSEDIVPKHWTTPQEWNSYIHGRRVLIVFRNWEHVTGGRGDSEPVGGTVVVDRNNPENAKIVLDRRIPAPKIRDPHAWIEILDEKTGKVLARLRSHELHEVATGMRPHIKFFWAHVAAEEKWPGWERFADRAKELDEKLGTWRPSSTNVTQLHKDAAAVNQDGTVVKVTNAPTEYVPPKVPEDVRRQFENLLSELKKLRDNMNLKNVDEAHSKFIQLRDKALDVARLYPQLTDEANSAVEEVGSKIRETYDKLYNALAKAAGRDSFWRGDGDVKTSIGLYRHHPATGTFLLAIYDGPVAENIVGYIKEDGTPVVVKKTQNMSEAEEEYSRLVKGLPSKSAEQADVKQIAVQQSRESQQIDFQQSIHSAADFLTVDFLRNVRETRGLPVPVVQDQPHPPSPLGILTKTPVIGPVLHTAKLLPQMPGYDVLTKMPVLGPLLQTTDLLLRSRSDSSKTSGGSSSEPAPTPTQPTTQTNNMQRDFLWPVHSAVDFLAKALKTGAGVKLTVLGAAEPSPADEQQFFATVPGIESESGAVYNKRHGGEFIQSLSSRQQKADGSVSIKLARPPDYVLVEQESQRSEETRNSAQTSSSYRLADYVASQQSSSGERSAQPPVMQIADAPQVQEAKRYRGKPAAVPI